MRRSLFYFALAVLLGVGSSFAGRITSINAFLKGEVFTVKISKEGDCPIERTGESSFELSNCSINGVYHVGAKGDLIKDLSLKPSNGNTVIYFTPKKELNYSYTERGGYVLIEVFPKNFLKPTFSVLRINKNEILDIKLHGYFNLIPKKEGAKVILEAKGSKTSYSKLKPDSKYIDAIYTYEKSGSAFIEISLKDRYPVEVTGSGGEYRVKVMPIPTYGYKSLSKNKVSLEFINADVRSVVRAIADYLELNVVFDPDVSGKVSISLKKPVYWEDALHAVLDPLGLTYVKTRNYLRITSKEKLLKEARLEPVYTYVVPLNYADAESVAKMIKQLIEKRKTRVTERLAEREAVQVDKRTNSIILKVTKDHYEKAMKIINRIDRRTRQIFVKAKIVQINSNVSKQLGISWGISAYNGHSPYLTASTGFFSASPGGDFPLIGVVDPDAIRNIHNIPIGSQTLALGFLNRSQTIKAELAIKALETDGTAKIISNPQIVTLDNEEASIEQGIEIPYTESTVASGGATSYTISFKKASLILKVKPHVTNDGNILLNVEVRKDTPNYEHVQLTGSNEPAINTRNVKSTVMIRDGDTLIIGGIYERERDVNRSGIPGLSRIPLLGWLFRQKSDTIKSTELLIFITPQILK